MRIIWFRNDVELRAYNEVAQRLARTANHEMMAEGDDRCAPVTPLVVAFGVPADNDDSQGMLWYRVADGRGSTSWLADEDMTNGFAWCKDLDGELA